MILVYSLEENFPNTTVLSIDTSVKIEKEISLEDFYIFCDNKNNVNSINVLNTVKYGIKSKKPFYVLSEKISKEIIKILSKKNKELVFNNFIKFQYGKIIKREQHPKSNKLFLVTLLINQKTNETITLVTNTLDSQENKVVVFAKKGSATANGLEVLDSEIVGVKSSGMLVGYETLGLEENSLIFGDDKLIGKKFTF